MKKNSALIVGIIIVLIVVIGSYLIFHKSKTTTPTSYSSTNSSSSTQQTTSINNSIVITKNNSSLGNYLAEPNGEALYTFGADTTGVSNCTGSCLSTWPAYLDKGSTKDLPKNIGTIKRTDNQEIQYTYKGLPLYTFVGDSDGKVTGNGVSNFHVAKP